MLDVKEINYLLSLINSNQRELEKELKNGCEIPRAREIVKRYDILGQVKSKLWRWEEELKNK